jgi:hypothetical protein
MRGGWWWSAEHGAAANSGDIVVHTRDSDCVDVLMTRTGVANRYLSLKGCRVGLETEYTVNYEAGGQVKVRINLTERGRTLCGTYREFFRGRKTDEGNFIVPPLGEEPTYTKEELTSMHGPTWCSWLRFRYLQWQGVFQEGYLLEEEASEASDTEIDKATDGETDTDPDPGPDTDPDPGPDPNGEADVETDPGPNIEPDAVNE